MVYLPNTKSIQIAGGGIAGLTAAIQLKRSKFHPIVFEKESRIGDKRHGDYEGLENWIFTSKMSSFFSQTGFENYWQITFLVLGIIIILCNIGLMFVHEPLTRKRQEDQIKSDQIIEKDLSSTKRNYLKILGGILLIFSILELLPEFAKTKNLLPFLPLSIIHYIIISILVGGLSYFFIKRNALIFTSVFIVFVFFFKILLSFVIVSIILGILGIALLNMERDWGKKTSGWISGRIGGPLITFFKQNGLKIALGILAFVFPWKLLWFHLRVH